MPFVIYIFSIFAFALGMAEFGQIGLLDIISGSLKTAPENIGKLVTFYALGATISAPILTALSANLSRKNALLLTTAIFTLGSLVTALGLNLSSMVLSRFVSGLGHGLFVAVATSTAARLVGKEKSGSAIATVFSGFTLAMAIGVPLSTYLGGVLPWRWVLALITISGALGFFGLLFGMKNPLKTEQKVNPMDNIKLIANKTLLKSAAVTFFSYSGAFATYTYIAPFLIEITHEASEMVSVYMLIFGVSAAVGNIAGGKLTDKLGIVKANVILVGALAISSALVSVFGASAVMMKIVIAVLGFFTFSVVPSLQAYQINEAHKLGGQADSVAAGLNVAASNLAIATGSVVGGWVMKSLGLASVGFAGAVLSVIGLSLLLILSRKQRALKLKAA